MKFATWWGLSISQPNPLDILAIDRHLQIPQDPAHALLQNLTHTLIAASLALLSPLGKQAFISNLHSYPLPHGWSRFQNPIDHLSSYFFSDYARLMAIGPFLIGDLVEEHFSWLAIKPIQSRLSARCSQVISEIVKCWVIMAVVNATCFAEVVNDYEQIKKLMLELFNQLLKVLYIPLCHLALLIQ
jgi:hypothetical protein